MRGDDQQKAINPLMIQSYFDGESRSDEFSAISGEDLTKTPTWQALNELRQAVRLDAESVIDSIDSYALLSSIQERIERESAKAPAVMHASRRSCEQKPSARGNFMRWLPTLIGAALFLCSLPGIIQIAAQDGDSSRLTDARIAESAQVPQCPSQQSAIAGNADSGDDALRAPNNQDTVQYARHGDMRLQRNAQSNQQLTVEELDFALRRLVDRIENLERANQKNIESGKSAILDEIPDAPHKI